MKPSMSGIGGNAGRRTLTVPPVKVRSGTPNAATFSSQRSSRVHCFTAPETVIIASRGSKLALEQSNQVISQLQACLPATTSFSIKEVKTRGDLSNAPTMKALGAGAFTDEVDAEVASGHASLAVHSLKDSPVVLPPGVALAACLRREDVRDAFISLGGVKCLGDLPAGSRVGTSSTRRKAQILHHYPHLEVVPLRGNVDVRLEKIACGDADATVLALSGLKRLGKADVVSSVIDEAQILPAACQGAIGITCMEGDSDMMSLLSSIGHFPTLLEVMCERALLHGIVGDAKELPSFAVACRAKVELSNTAEPTAASPVDDVLASDSLSGDVLASDSLSGAPGRLILHCAIADPRGLVLHKMEGDIPLDRTDVLVALLNRRGGAVGAVAQVSPEEAAVRKRLIGQAEQLGHKYGSRLRDLAVQERWM